MICFEVHINGMRVCTAGVGEFGVLTSTLGWARIHPARRPQCGAKDDESADLFLTVGGLTSSGKDSGEHLWWLEHQRLQVGDEIMIRIANRTTCDQPRAHVREEEV